LTGANITISIAPTGAGGQGLYGQAVTVIDAPNGWISFQLPAPLSLPPGIQSASFLGQVKVDFGSGDVQHTSVFDITLEKSVGPTL